MLLSVRLQTYNQQDFIEQALQGIEDQITNFNFEVVIGDDFSTDDSVKVIEKIISNSKNSKIEYKFLRRKKGDEYWKKRHKLGRLYNFFNIIENCTGKYIALLDGDDYWTDPLKLQKQVDFLEVSNDYNICFHNVKVFNQEQNSFETDIITREVPTISTINDLAEGNYIHTPSVVYRNNFKLPKWFLKSPIGDWSIYMVVIKDKKIKKFEDVMAVYRVHDKSLWALKSNEYRILNTINSMNLLVNSKVINSDVKLILKSQIKKYEAQLLVKKNVFNRVFNKIKKLLNA